MSSRTIYLAFVKPLSDKIIAALFLFILFPIGLVLTMILLIVNRGQVFFVQARVGKNESIFKLFKFKTMLDVSAHENKPKITFFGSLLRKLSLDELPQLVNVLRGEMSLIGPRPLLVEYLGYYDRKERKRHSVRPGITGWAQVRGRNKASWASRMKDDLYYVSSVSLFLDFKIVLLTLIQLFNFTQADFEDQNEGTFIDYAKKR